MKVKVGFVLGATSSEKCFNFVVLASGDEIFVVIGPSAWGHQIITDSAFREGLYEIDFDELGGGRIRPSSNGLELFDRSERFGGLSKEINDVIRPAVLKAFPDSESVEGYTLPS
jgi:hypothetical protein